MKKLICIALLVLMVSQKSLSQGVDFSVGVSAYNSDVNNVGVNIGFSYNHFYMDFSSNITAGKGEELNYRTSSTYKTNKISIVVLSGGYNIYVTDNWSITPVLGVVSKQDIFQDPVGWDTFFYGNTEYIVNLGLHTKVYLADHFGFIVGGGTYENFKACMVYKF